ncbi:unnamed protein product [Rotaria magnacalcarata]|uniref:Uncharacterized protein n=4 Tax=Rotaria magnacalcarata TaxID=392030 RepID=A0A816EDD9_9BILA|nr:unnamed protein product [Rotaria magnacalcarata]
MFSGRSRRDKKTKKIFSPSDPLQPHYYLIFHDGPEKYRVVGRISVQQLSNGKAVVSNIDGDVQIITSGSMEHCRRELKLKMQKFEHKNKDRKNEDDDDEDDDDERDEADDDDIRIYDDDDDDDDDDEVDDNHNDGDHSYIDYPTTSGLKRPSDGFSTPALKRSYNKSKALSQSNPSRKRDRSLQNNNRYELNITDSNDLYAKNSHNRYPDKMPGNVSRSIDSQNDHHSNANIVKTDSELMLKQEMISCMKSVKKQLAKLAKKVDFLAIPSSSSKSDQLSSYRDENDKENYRDTIPWQGKDLLQITARDIGDYGRRLLDTLFTPEELQKSILPSSSAHLYDKDVLDEKRFKLLNDAIRTKYRLSTDGYHRYYTNILRVKFSRYLYDQGTRKLNKETKNKNQELNEQQYQPSRQPQPRTTTEIV